jgi:tetratricopeptide (TPR) repeat protein
MVPLCDRKKYSIWNTRMSLAQMAYERGLYAAAARNYKLALEIGEELGLKQEQLASNLLGLAKCFSHLGNFTEAEQLYGRLLEMDKSMFGNEHEEVVYDLGELAALYKRAGKFQQAESLLQHAIAIAKTSSQSEDDLGPIFNDMAQVSCCLGKTVEAEDWLKRASAVCKPRASQKTKLHADILITRASLAAQNSHSQEATQMIDEAVEIMEMITGGEHPDLADLLESASSVMRNAKFPEEADAFVRRAAAIRARLKSVDR